ncbi:MAG: hypothetical protein JOZ65_22750 [Chloroflexi bacterium]|nr:hypothetical protein [Chloroflexota bacterium]
MTTFIFHGNQMVNPDEEYGPLQAEFERRGFPCRVIHSPHHAECSHAISRPVVLAGDKKTSRSG